MPGDVLAKAINKVGLGPASGQAPFVEPCGEFIDVGESFGGVGAFAPVATADHVRAQKGLAKRINISFDEWNVWYMDRFEKVDRIEGIDNWPIAPRLLEDVYSVADAVVFGSLLISLLKHSDRVASASLAQLVNVIAPIMTEPGGPAWRQTTFYPFSITSRLAKGVVLQPNLASPTYETRAYGEVPLVDAVITTDEDEGRSAVFLVNRSQSSPATVTVETDQLGDVEVVESYTLSDDDAHATNTLQQPTRVVPKTNSTVNVVQGRLTITLPPPSRGRPSRFATGALPPCNPKAVQRWI